MDDERLLRWRLRVLRLTGPPLDAPADVVGRLGAVQSQDYGPAKWSVGRRSAGATDAELDVAYEAGDILRTHVLRPTWHFVARDDIRWLVEVTGPRVQVRNASRYRELGLDERVRGRAADLLGEALVGGRRLTRPEVGALWKRAGIDVDGQRLPYLLMHAELELVVCSGGLSGRQHTYALVDERAPDAPRLSREEGLAELVRRYFTSHGPATAADLQAWSSLTMADIRAGLATAGLENMDVGERTFWFAEPLPASPDPPVAHLLQGYDELVMGYRDSRYLIAPRTGAPALGVVTLDGRVAGWWRRRGRTVEVGLYEEVPVELLEAEAARYGAFLGAELTLRPWLDER